METPVKPPDKIKVGYKTLRVVPTKDFRNPELPDQLGEFSREANLIKYRPVLSADENANTLLHEVLHACFYVYGLSVPFADDKQEELIVNTLTNALVAVFKDNPKFATYLMESLDDTKKRQ
jgi:hypothetical protein